MQVLTPHPTLHARKSRNLSIDLYWNDTEFILKGGGGGWFWQCSVISFGKAGCGLRLEQ